jgi:hypothetical protein
MKTITQSNQVQITASLPEIRKINEHLLKPLKAGFLGFTTILMIIFFINLFSYIIGTNEKFGMDVLDLLLAGVGFFLQSAGALLKSFVR